MRIFNTACFRIERYDGPHRAGKSRHCVDMLLGQILAAEKLYNRYEMWEELHKNGLFTMSYRTFCRRLAKAKEKLPVQSGANESGKVLFVMAS